MQSSGYLVLFLAFVLRLMLFSTNIPDWFLERNEFSTPISSWRRLTEGLTLLQNGISPYEGDLYHEMPLTLLFWKYMLQIFGDAYMKYFFIILDIAIGLFLYLSCDLFSIDLIKQQKKNSFYKITTKDVENNKLISMSFYLLNPLTIASCMSFNTAILCNFFIILAFVAALLQSRIALSFFLSIATYLSLYPFLLIIPLSFIIAHKDKQNNRQEEIHKEIFTSSSIQTIICFASITTFLLFYSKDHDWQFLRSTFGFILTAPDHSPNIGIFWYFFVENFEHFKTFFLCIFQIHVFVYVLPLSMRLFHQPYFASFCTLAFIGIFKSYSSFTDLTLWLAIACHFGFVFSRMRNVFLAGNFHVKNI